MDDLSRNNPYMANGKSSNGIYSQMMLMDDNVFSKSISKESLDKLFNSVKPEIDNELDVLTIFGTAGGIYYNDFRDNLSCGNCHNNKPGAVCHCTLGGNITY